MKKKILACLLVLAMLFLTACGTKEDVTLLGDKDSRDPLRICIDLIDFSSSDMLFKERAWDDFLFRLKETAGLEDVVLELIPSPYDFENGMADTTLRAAAIDRIRSEIMAGGGPDVFLMTYMTYMGTMGTDFDATDCLFKYPQKAMENGIFLPLDEYIENHAELGDWDKLTKPVLEAGRNEEGQQIIPLNYTLPLWCCLKSEWEHIPDKKYTWNDMLSNPELLPYSLDFANCGRWEYGLVGSSLETAQWETNYSYYPEYIKYIMGEFADYENETLGFTEEELQARVSEILALERDDAYEDTFELYLGEEMTERTLNKPMTFLPIYNADGGITAEIKDFAAVNRNTKRPEDAFRVIDLLMNKNVQLLSGIYAEFIHRFRCFPMHEELFREETPVNHRSYYMTDENFEAFSKVREQITGANFYSEGTELLSQMMSHCVSEAYLEHYEKTVEEVVHEAYEDMQRRVKE